MEFSHKTATKYMAVAVTLNRDSYLSESHPASAQPWDSWPRTSRPGRRSMTPPDPAACGVFCVWSAASYQNFRYQPNAGESRIWFKTAGLKDGDFAPRADSVLTQKKMA